MHVSWSVKYVCAHATGRLFHGEVKKKGTYLLVRMVYSPRRVIFILGVVRDVVTWSSSSALVGHLFHSEHYDSLATFCHLQWVKTHEPKHSFCTVIPSAESVCFWKTRCDKRHHFVIIYEGLAVLVDKKVSLPLFQQQPWVLHLLTNVIGVVVLCNFVEAFVRTVAWLWGLNEIFL